MNASILQSERASAFIINSGAPAVGLMPDGKH